MGDLYGKKRLFVCGLVGTIVFDLLAALSPNAVVLLIARTLLGVSFSLLMGLSLANSIRNLALAGLLVVGAAALGLLAWRLGDTLLLGRVTSTAGDEEWTGAEGGMAALERAITAPQAGRGIRQTAS
jgi:MFS family permease